MRYITTNDSNITFTDTNGKVMVVPKNRVYTHFNVDTVTFLLIERYDNEGICIFTTMAEDLQINGTTYTYEQLLDGEGISDLFSPTGLSFEVVEELPQVGEDGVIYLVPNDDNTYNEYIWISEEERFEPIGSTDVDLTNYYTKAETDEAIQEALEDIDLSDYVDKETYNAKEEAIAEALTDLHDSLDNFYTKTDSDSKYATQTVVNQEIAARISADSDINSTLQSKADKSDTYTKSQVDTAIENASPFILDLSGGVITDAMWDEASDAIDTHRPIYIAIPLSSGLTPTLTVEAINFTDTNRDKIWFIVTDKDFSDNVWQYLYVITKNGSNDYNLSFDSFKIVSAYTKEEVNNGFVAKETGKGLSTNDYTTAEKNKLAGIAAGAEVNVQANWNETNTSSDAYIQNKPTIPDVSNYYTKSQVDTALALKQDSSTAFSGDYDDLTNKPDLSVYAESADLATVARTGDYDDLSNKPTIPAAQVNADWNASSGVAQILNKPTNVSAFTNDAGYLTQHQSLANYYTKSEVDTELADKQDSLVSGTNIKTINNESILGQGNIEIQGGGGGMDEDTELLISSALVDLNDRKIDASEVKEKYQKKGDYATNAKVDTKANISDVPTNVDYFEAQKITSWALNDLNNKIGDIETILASI